MILDMIQGCRYSRRSTDRMNPLEELDDTTKDSRVCRKAGLYWECFWYNYIQPGSIFIPCHGMTSNGLRAQYLIPNLSLSAITYPSIRLLRSGHVIAQSHKISANSFLAERKQIADRGLLCRILLEKPSFSRTDFSPGWTHKSDSLLYQILVLTSAASIIFFIFTCKRLKKLFSYFWLKCHVLLVKCKLSQYVFLREKSICVLVWRW
jgi:hypothetical protein